MKRYIILIVLMKLFLISCYDDKGNYDYEELPRIIDVDSIPSSLLKFAYDTLRIYPEIHSFGEDSYDYRWALYEMKDTLVNLGVIGNEKDLEYVLAHPSGENYNILFTAKSETTGVEWRKRISLKLTSTMNQGWYVMKSLDGEVDLDYYSADSSIIAHNYLSGTYGLKLNGKSGRLAYQNRYRDYDINGNLTFNTSRLFAFTNEDFIVVNISNEMITRNSPEDLFYRAPSNKDFQRFFQAWDFYLLNGGKLHKINSYTQNIGRFSEIIPHPIDPTMEYSFSPQVAGYYDNAVLFFDEISSSFMATTSSSMVLRLFDPPVASDDEELISTRNMSYDLVYMGYQLPFGSAKALALMRHKETSEYMCFEIRIKNGGSDPILSRYPVTNTDLIKSEIMTAHTYIRSIYYFDNNKLMLHNLLDNSKTVIKEYSSGEVPVFLKIDTNKVTNGDIILFVGMSVGDNYRVYRYLMDINTGAIISSPGKKDQETNLFEGPGYPYDVTDVSHANSINS